MSKTLRFISISHKTASVSKREEYHISDRDKNSLITLIQTAFVPYLDIEPLSTA